jgi:hypothetical protein
MVTRLSGWKGNVPATDRRLSAALVEAVTLRRTTLVKGAVDSRGLVKSIRYAIERMRADQRTHLAGVADPVTAVANSAVFADRLQLALDPFETPGIDPPTTARL